MWTHLELFYWFPENPWEKFFNIFDYRKKNKQDVQLVLKARWNGACILLQQAMMITEHVGHHL